MQEDASLISLRQASLDPGVNLLFGKMREELQQTKDKLEQAQSELSAWKFTPDRLALNSIFYSSCNFLLLKLITLALATLVKR